MHIVRGWLLFFLAMGWALSAQSTDGELLARIRQQAAKNLTRLPNFTCLETIERSRRQAPARRYQLVDIARVEVALVQSKELFAWPGSGRFDDRDLRELIPGGASGNGSFALHARAVFLGRHTTFEALGEVDFQGRRALRFAYTVPQPFSGFTIRNGNNAAVVGYVGEFLAAKDTLDLLRLTVRGTDLPVTLAIQDHQEALEYQRVKIGESDYLLPRSSDMSLTDAEGLESRNRTAFTNCRQYGAESVISFDVPEEDAAATAVKPAQARGPVESGLEIEIGVKTKLELGKTAVGDVVSATVTRDVKRDKQVLIPKNATVKGRVIHFERAGEMRVGNKTLEVIYVAFDFTEIATKEWFAPLFGTLKGVIAVPDPRLSARYDDYGRILTGYHASGQNVAVVYNDMRLSSGLRLVWESRSTPLPRTKP